MVTEGKEKIRRRRIWRKERETRGRRLGKLIRRR